jgi:hypothetical protein
VTVECFGAPVEKRFSYAGMAVPTIGKPAPVAAALTVGADRSSGGVQIVKKRCGSPPPISFG